MEALGWEDAYSVGCLTLVKCAGHFDPMRGFRFTTYACNAIRNDIFREARKDAKHRGIAFTPEWPDVPSPIDHSDWDEELVPSLLAKTPGRHREAVKLRFGLDAARKARTLKQVGKKLGVSSERARQMVTKSLDLMRS